MAAASGRDNQSGSAGGALPAAPSGSATEWAAFLDSISGLSLDYHEALIMARRTVPPAAGQPAEGAPSNEDIRTVGWSAFTNRATLGQVIQALDYDLGHACPWRKLGVPKLEGPIPSARYLDLRLRKVLTLLQAGAAAEWTAEDRSAAEQAITTMRTAYGTVAEALPEVIRARGQERIGMEWHQLMLSHPLPCSATWMD